MRYILSFFIIIFLFSCQLKYKGPKTIQLHQNWEFKKVEDTLWNPATVPGDVFSDLLDNNLIKHPFIGNNIDSLYWVSEVDWEYKTTFKLDEKILQKKHIELNFEGLDTYATVILNDNIILKSNNAFRGFKIDVKSILKLVNEMKIIFKSTSKYEEVAKANSLYNLPEGNRIYTRKAQFQYGWDWGPKLNTAGIWKPLELIVWDDFKTENLYLNQITLTDSIAEMSLILETNSEENVAYDLELFINDTLTNQYRDFNLNERDTFNFKIRNPKKWWPHNIGEPYLYNIKVLIKEGNTILDSISIKKGFRTIELVTEKDSIGESFYFKVNDIPVYVKGANYIPQNSMQNKVSDADYDNLLNDVADANMNMLRVWGGGIYENTIFYDLCDEKGILVWQDFMFACAMYPGDETFLENVKIEAEEQVKRLQNHASIALWCGNNESREGWHRWGWQSGRSKKEKEAIWNDYLAVFDSILPKTVNQYSNTNYWESSPKYGRGNPKYKTEGDAHDWWIWHDAFPFEYLEENVPRFMSEFGFQSFPSYEAIKYINQNDTINITSDVFKTHQKHSRGFQLVEDYMQRDFPVPTNPEDYVYVSQLLQAYGITKGIESQRRAKPYNMGTVYWQLNDCWPVVSWSSIDFFGNWKALHYKAKRSFKDVLISPKTNGDNLNVYIVNDDLQTYSSKLSLEILDFSGNQIWTDIKEISVDENSSNIKYQLDLKTLSFNKDEVLLISKFNKEIRYFYFVKPKDLKLIESDILQKITKSENGFSIELFSKTLQKDVFLFSDNKGHFSDNFFDLLPNQKQVINFKTEALSLSDLKIKSLNQLLKQP